MRIFFILLLGSLFACGPSTLQKRIQRTFEQANTQLEQGYYDEAIALYSQVIDKDPEIIDAFMNRGVAYFESGHFVLALADYNHVYFNYPEYPEVVFNLVYCHIALRRFDQAKNDLVQLKNLYPDSALVDVIEGLFWTEQNVLTQAEKSFTSAIEKDPMNFDAWTNRGILNYQFKKYEEAESDLTTALKINQNAPEVLNPLALVLAQTGRATEADSLINMALKMALGHPFYLNNKGFVQLMLQNIPAADSLIRRSISIDSLNAHAYKNLAKLRMAEDKKEEAKQAMDRALALDSTLLETYDLMLAYFEKYGGKPDKTEILQLRQKFFYQ